MAPTDHILYSNRSGSYASLAKYDEALADAEKCISLNAGFAKGILFNLICWKVTKGRASPYIIWVSMKKLLKVINLDSRKILIIRHLRMVWSLRKKDSTNPSIIHLPTCSITPIFINYWIFFLRIPGRLHLPMTLNSCKWLGSWSQTPKWPHNSCKLIQESKQLYQLSLRIQRLKRSFSLNLLERWRSQNKKESTIIRKNINININIKNSIIMSTWKRKCPSKPIMKLLNQNIKNNHQRN